MRGLGVCAIALCVGAVAATAVHAQSDALTATLDSLHRDANGVTIDKSLVRQGSRSIEANEHLTGDAASFHGPLEIHGTVDGNAVAIGGDVVLYPGGHVRGDALSVGGTVQLAGGTVDGETRSISALSVGRIAGVQLTPAQAMRRSMSLSLACFLILAAMALAVAFFARGHLETISTTIRTDFARALIVGLLGEVAIAPLFVLSAVALAITVVGILLIPFAAFAFALAVLGALALGFLAMALLAGDALIPGDERVMRSRPIIFYLIAGLALFLVLWLLASLSSYAGLAGTVLRLLAVLGTWIAVTVGFGATIITRGGSRSPAALPSAPSTPAWQPDANAWSTPTPVSGVAAARRPTPAPRPSQQ